MESFWKTYATPPSKRLSKAKVKRINQILSRVTQQMIDTIRDYEPTKKGGSHVGPQT